MCALRSLQHMQESGHAPFKHERIRSFRVSHEGSTRPAGQKPKPKANNYVRHAQSSHGAAVPLLLFPRRRTPHPFQMAAMSGVNLFANLASHDFGQAPCARDFACAGVMAQRRSVSVKCRAQLFGAHGVS